MNDEGNGAAAGGAEGTRLQILLTLAQAQRALAEAAAALGHAAVPAVGASEVMSPAPAAPGAANRPPVAAAESDGSDEFGHIGHLEADPLRFIDQLESVGYNETLDQAAEQGKALKVVFDLKPPGDVSSMSNEQRQLTARLAEFLATSAVVREQSGMSCHRPPPPPRPGDSQGE